MKKKAKKIKKIISLFFLNTLSMHLYLKRFVHRDEASLVQYAFLPYLHLLQTNWAMHKVDLSWAKQ